MLENQGSVDAYEDTANDLPPGTKLMYGQYTVEQYLSSGGFGITYLAQDSLNRLVVIKECFPSSFCRRTQNKLRPHSRENLEELNKIVGLFTQEALSLAKVEHPNIVGVHQVFEENNTAYMALDFVRGRDLQDIALVNKIKLQPEQVTSILSKLLDAIGHVHENGLLHRDISPDNIIIRDDGEPVLIDFGAAREQSTRKTRVLSAMQIVKDGYSPQEFYVADSNQSPSCDLYSLAATFYHIITGHRPPDAQRRITALASQEPDPYQPLAGLDTEYDSRFCAVLDRALNVLPKDRVQSAEEWLAELGRKGSMRRISKRVLEPEVVQPDEDGATSGTEEVAHPSQDLPPQNVTSFPAPSTNQASRPRSEETGPFEAGAADAPDDPAAFQDQDVEFDADTSSTEPQKKAAHALKVKEASRLLLPSLISVPSSAKDIAADMGHPNSAGKKIAIAASLAVLVGAGAWYATQNTSAVTPVTNDEAAAPTLAGADGTTPSTGTTVETAETAPNRRDTRRFPNSSAPIVQGPAPVATAASPVVVSELPSLAALTEAPLGPGIDWPLLEAVYAVDALPPLPAADAFATSLPASEAAPEALPVAPTPAPSEKPAEVAALQPSEGRPDRSSV